MAKERTELKEKLSKEELDAVSGGADRNYKKQGCATTVEFGSHCWSNDQCAFVSVIYDN